MSGGLGLFQGYGVEIECAIVDADTLDVRPVAERILVGDDGELGDVERGDFAWSNELTAHVVELKTNGPAPRLEGLAAGFAREIAEIDRRLAPHGARLMPAGMHPWMDPARETTLWPHGYRDVYETFDRIFGCSGHGWANLQSVHLNLPFRGDDEFARLHAAIRLVLPIVPALAASTPFREGRAGGPLDGRMSFYGSNSRRVPSVAGAVIPEPVFTRRDYEERILGRIYEDMRPLDPEGTLRHEWLNARGAIARFDRDAIEIRTIDSQECPRADLAVAGLVAGAVRALVEERRAPLDAQKAWEVEPLAAILRSTIADADRATIADPAYLEAFGAGRGATTAGALWRAIAERLQAEGDSLVEADALAEILDRGPLARRILRAAGDDPAPPRERLREVYRELCDCLREGRIFP